MMKKLEKVEQKDLNKVVGGVSEVASAQTASTAATRIRTVGTQAVKTQSVSTRGAKTAAGAKSRRGLIDLGLMIPAFIVRIIEKNK